MRRFIISLIFACLLAGCAVPDAAPADPTAPTTEQSLPPAETESSAPPVTEPNPSEVTEPTPTEPEPQAQTVTGDVQVLCSGVDITRILSDGSHLTKYEISKSVTLRITSDVPFRSLYLQWDVIPGEYELSFGEEKLLCGTEGFLHEYVTLPYDVQEVTFIFLQSGRKVLCEAASFTAGTAPDGVQVWLPPCTEADILIFPTHSDDDVLFFGPLISYYAIEKGLTVQTAFMVDHSWQYERNHERLNGLWEMGVRHYPILGSAPDTAEHSFSFGMSYYANSNILQWQVEQIRRFRPLVVIGHDLEGEYGNAGHKVNAYYLTQAVEAAADPELFPESAADWGIWDTPKFYIHLYPENEWYFDVNTPLSADPQGRTPFQIAQDAFRCHVSQNTGFLRVQQEDDARQWDCRPFGLYRTLVGPDTAADVMENIDPAQWRK